jgi:hypothetical protein
VCELDGPRYIEQFETYEATIEGAFAEGAEGASEVTSTVHVEHFIDPGECAEGGLILAPDPDESSDMVTVELLSPR